ncbi:MAG: hypothetical protein WBA76_16540 [Phormidesmis sp.]
MDLTAVTAEDSALAVLFILSAELFKVESVCGGSTFGVTVQPNNKHTTERFDRDNLVVIIKYS